MAEQPQQPPMPDMGPMKIMFIMMIVILFVYFIDGDDHIIGNVLNYGLSFLDFGGQYPVLTLICSV